MNWLQSILADAREAYGDAATREALERPSDRAWEKFQRTLEIALTGADFIAVARMRHAPRDPYNLPKWWEPHRELTKPAVVERARIVAGIERAFYRDQGALIEQQLDETLESRFQLLWRLSSAEIANEAEQVQLALPGGRERWPFAEYFTMDDARVRPTHALMAGFVAVSWWEGWSKVRPPNGWGCRCRLIFRSMDHAITRKWATRAGPKWETRWPSSGAETNFLYGVFPDQGWQGPKVFAGALDTPHTVGV